MRSLGQRECRMTDGQINSQKRGWGCLDRGLRKKFSSRTSLDFTGVESAGGKVQVQSCGGKEVRREKKESVRRLGVSGHLDIIVTVPIGELKGA